MSDRPTISYGMTGKLYLSKSGWLMLAVPNAVVRGAFAALNEPGVELPLDDDGKLSAHISVIRPEELETIPGGAGAITERGKDFAYTLGPIRSVTPNGWKGVSKVWLIEVRSPGLKKFRKSYSLTALPNDNKFQLHITVAIRKVGALGENDVSKATSFIHTGDVSQFFKAAQSPAMGIPQTPYKAPAPLTAAQVNNPPKPTGPVVQPFSKLHPTVQYHLGGRSGSLAQSRKVTPAYLLAPYYKNVPGGLDAAAAAARKVPAPSNAPRLDLTREGLLRSVNQHQVPDDIISSAPYGVSGWSAQSPDVVTSITNPDQMQKPTLTHEMTHQMQRMPRGAGSLGLVSGETPKDTGSLSPGDAWFQRPEEIDAYAAGPIKRMYAKLTGKLVTTPEEAREALRYIERDAMPAYSLSTHDWGADWTREWLEEQVAAADSDITLTTDELVDLTERFRGDPALQNDIGAFRNSRMRRRSLPQEAKRAILDYLLKRMPGIVSVPQGLQGIAKTSTLTTKQMIATERRKVETDPTEAQIEAGNYRKGHVTIHGLEISIENPKGSTRSGTSPAGKEWSIELKNDYGYIRTTEGSDGDAVDVFIGDSPDTELVFVVNQLDPKTKKWDEHKAVLGCDTMEEAKETYLANYEKGWNGMGEVVVLTIPRFKAWLESGNTKKPIKESLVPKTAEVSTLQMSAEDKAFWKSPPNKAGRKCPGCKRLFKEVEPLPNVEMCETCERFGPPKEAAAGIPDRSDMGDLSKLAPGLVDFVIQYHQARRAGPHYDVRFGSPDLGLFSWASRFDLPEPGQRRALFQQPLHDWSYKDFQGNLPRGGYGAGTVRTHRKGRVLVTKIRPGLVEFTTADRRYPERFVLLKPAGWKEKDWLLVNKTPQDAMPYEKVRYQKIDADQVEPAIEQMMEGDSVEAKVDGASTLVKLLEKGVEVTSYRVSKETGRPITHTERIFHGLPELQIPKHLQGTVLRGELYGVRPQAAGQDDPGDRGEAPQSTGEREPATGTALQGRSTHPSEDAGDVGERSTLAEEMNDDSLPRRSDSGRLDPWNVGGANHGVPGRSDRVDAGDNGLDAGPIDSTAGTEADRDSLLDGDGPATAADGGDLDPTGGAKPVLPDVAGRVGSTRAAEPERGHIPGDTGGGGAPGQSLDLAEPRGMASEHGPGLRSTIPPQELGGLLNATVGNSITQQRGRGIQLRNMIYDIEQLGHQPVGPDAPRKARRGMMAEVLQHLPPEVFHLSEAATSPEEAHRLWSQIRAGEHPLTTEGVVFHPSQGRPRKAKLLEESDVHVTDIFPGEGRLAGVGAGGFEYALEPGGSPVGRVGTGLSDALRRELHEDPESFVGRVAKIRSQGQHASGAYRAPSLLSWHEDFPMSKAGQLVHSNEQLLCTDVEIDSWLGEEKGTATAVLREKRADDDETPVTIAVDLDGTILKYDGWKGEDHFGDPRSGARKALKELQRRGYLIVINTCRGNTQAVKDVLFGHDLPFDYVNTNPNQPPGTSDKIQADVYIDDRAVDGRQSWKAITKETLRRVKASGGSIYMQALQTTPPVYNPNMSVTQNLMGHLRAVQARGDRTIREAHTQDAFANAADPNRASRRMFSYISGQRQPVVSHWLDRAIQGETPFGRRTDATLTP